MTLTNLNLSMSCLPGLGTVSFLHFHGMTKPGVCFQSSCWEAQDKIQQHRGYRFPLAKLESVRNGKRELGATQTNPAPSPFIDLLWEELPFQRPRMESVHPLNSLLPSFRASCEAAITPGTTWSSFLSFDLSRVWLSVLSLCSPPSLAPLQWSQFNLYLSLCLWRTGANTLLYYFNRIQVPFPGNLNLFKRQTKGPFPLLKVRSCQSHLKFGLSDSTFCVPKISAELY